MRIPSLIAAGIVLVAPSVGAQSTARVEIVVASPAGEPLPFSEITVTPGQSRFTNEQGRLGLDAKPGVIYKIRLRHLGFAALDTTFVVSGTGRIELRLSPSPVVFNLTAVDVRERNDCRSIDSSPQLPVLLEELRKNAQRDSLLRYQYPFAYRLSRTYDTYDPQMRIASRFTTNTWYLAVPPDRYVPGSVIRESTAKRKASLREVRTLTLADIADEPFMRNHCFAYGGIVKDRGAALYRIDFEPSLSLRNKIDLAGSAYLDSISYMIRRLDLKLTNYSPYAISVSFTEMYRGLAIFDRIRSEQRMTGPAFMAMGENLIDDQKLVEVSFFRDTPVRDTGAVNPRPKR